MLVQERPTCWMCYWISGHEQVMLRMTGPCMGLLPNSVSIFSTCSWWIVRTCSRQSLATFNARCKSSKRPWLAGQACPAVAAAAQLWNLEAQALTAPTLARRPAHAHFPSLCSTALRSRTCPSAGSSTSRQCPLMPTALVRDLQLWISHLISISISIACLSQGT